jgi:hypothetical protein
MVGNNAVGNVDFLGLDIVGCASLELLLKCYREVMGTDEREKMRNEYFFNYVMLFLAMSLLSGCDEDRSQNKKVDEEVVNIHVGVFGPDGPEGFEYAYMGNGGLGYYLNLEFLGEDEKGASILLEKLSSLEPGATITVSNPLGATDKIDGRGKRDLSYPFPYVEDPKLRKRIETEMRRVAGIEFSGTPLESYGFPQNDNWNEIRFVLFDR